MAKSAFPNKRRRGNRKGESLLEVIVAFLVLATTSSAATVLITQSLRTSGLMAERVIAGNLARDGIEAFAGFRNTNWLKFSDGKQCWDVIMQSILGGEKCPGLNAKKIAPNLGNIAHFKFVLEPVKFEKKLEEVTTGALKLPEDPKQTLGKESNDPYAVYERTEEPNKGLFINYSKGSPVPSDPPKFYRMIQVQRIHEDALKINVIVQWRSGGAVHEVDLSSVFNNY